MDFVVFYTVLKIALCLFVLVGFVYAVMYVLSKLFWERKADNSFLAFIGLVIVIVFLLAILSGIGMFLYNSVHFQLA